MTIDGSAGRSYRLTSDLVVSSENGDGIRVDADDISIDLAGFEISGPVERGGFPLTCTPAEGSASGIKRTLGVEKGTSVRNGSIRGMGAFGSNLGMQAEVIDVRVRSNGGSGVMKAKGARVSGIVAHQNGGAGIAPGPGSTISGNSAHQKGGNGIQASSGCTVSGNTVRGNAGFGLKLGSQSGFRENVVSANLAGMVDGATALNLGDNACDGTSTCTAPE